MIALHTVWYDFVKMHKAVRMSPIDAGMRPMFGTPFGADPSLAPLHEWRDRTYRQHRGGRVEPAAA